MYYLRFCGLGFCMCCWRWRWRCCCRRSSIRACELVLNGGGQRRKNVCIEFVRGRQRMRVLLLLFIISMLLNSNITLMMLWVDMLRESVLSSTRHMSNSRRHRARGCHSTCFRYSACGSGGNTRSYSAVCGDSGYQLRYMQTETAYFLRFNVECCKASQ